MCKILSESEDLISFYQKIVFSNVDENSWWSIIVVITTWGKSSYFLPLLSPSPSPLLYQRKSDFGCRYLQIKVSPENITSMFIYYLKEKIYDNCCWIFHRQWYSLLEFMMTFYRILSQIIVFYTIDREKTCAKKAQISLLQCVVEK